jgi:hypothetical protein
MRPVLIRWCFSSLMQRASSKGTTSLMGEQSMKDGLREEEDHHVIPGRAAASIQKFLAKGVKMICHPPYSPDLAQQTFFFSF